MTQDPSSKRPFLVFYILGAYIIIQFIWWTYLMVDLNEQVVEQDQEIARLRDEPVEDGELNDRLWMIAGEGTVFLILLLLGMYRIKRSFHQELYLARQEKNFMMAVTHELKSPLTSIKLYLQTLKKHELEEKKRRSLADNAISESERLNGLIDNILLASRIENRNFTVSREYLNMGEAVREALQVPMETIGKEHEVELNLVEDVMVRMDRQALYSITSNLFENAVKYSPQGGKVSITVKKEKENGVLLVEDQGKGISKEEAVKLTRKFYRGGDEEVRDTKGTGLGLYIVSELVSLHSGKLLFEQGEPKGTVVKILIPLEEDR